MWISVCVGERVCVCVRERERERERENEVCIRWTILPEMEKVI